MVGESPVKAAEARSASAKVFDCPSCGAGVQIRAQGLTVSVVCTACGSVIDAANENYQIISKAARNLKIEPLIPLGQRGKIKGVLWEVIGFMRRCDGSGDFVWSEYLLFNPINGFRWLTEFDGHWNYVIQIKEKPVADTEAVALRAGRNVAKVLGKTYYMFQKGTAKVIYVVGEFYWRVKVDEKVESLDYICPPEILSCEKSKDEIVWSIGEYVQAETVKAAFQIAKPMPAQHGVAPNQPSLIATTAPAILKSWGLFLAVIVGIQFLSMVLANHEEVYRGDFVYRLNDPEKQKVTPQFELKHGESNVDVMLYSPVQNSWLEIEADLVNDDNGETEEFEEGVEFYSGYDSDGSWTEGSQVAHHTLSSIPSGKYHLNFQAVGPGSNPWSAETALAGQTYSITVTRGVITWSNFFGALILISIFPLIVWWRNRSFEYSRWSTSDYSPYPSQQGEDSDS